jgi:hypothetical protein
MSESMGNLPQKQTPTESMIESMLGQFQPLPTARFYRKINKSPWMKKGSDSQVSWLVRPRTIPSLVWGLAVVILILAFVGISFIPSVNAIARQIIFSFITAPSDQLKIQVTSSSPADLYHFSEPVNFPLRFTEAQIQADFELKQIQVLPKGLVFVGARYDAFYKAVTILYQADDYNLFLTQRLIGNGEDVFSIGANAEVSLVKVGNYHGEFVMGGWKAISTPATSDKTTPVSQTEINAIWDKTLPQNTLRWQTEGHIYEMRTIGEGSPSQSELIALANELK